RRRPPRRRKPPVDDFWTSRHVCHGRAAALDAIGTMHATYYAVGGSRPGIACMAVDGTTQNGDHQPRNETATRILGHYGLPADATRTVRGRAVILAGFDCNPRPIPAPRPTTSPPSSATRSPPSRTAPDRSVSTESQP
ncbi:hypothetical protein GS905_26085, partial [Rhodococcus hoagii]|nr:hypothetical protein [Prescottella equi]